MEILVPAYRYPTLGTMWATLAAGVPAGGSGVRVDVILNPASGPGTQVDPVYVAAVQGARAAGARILGYVDTGYGSVASDSVLAQVQAYMTMYGIDGVFLDDLDNSPPPSGTLAYAQQITAGIHAMLPGSLVVANPGAAVPESFVAQNAADVLVTYENDLLSATEPYGATPPPAWVSSYPAGRFANIVYNVAGVAAMQTAVSLARTRNVGVIYVTDAAGADSYDVMPSYWAQEFAPARGCPADFDCSGTVTVQDIFDFLSAWFARDPRADFDGSGSITVQDIFDFLGAWFSKCG